VLRIHADIRPVAALVPGGVLLRNIKAGGRIPVFFAALAAPTSLRTSAKAMEKRRRASISDFVVIVVDDDVAVRNSLTFSLAIEGFTVRGYATGDELLNAGDLASCNCLVIDQKLPDLDGLDLIAKVRDRHIAAPAILITSHPSLLLRRRAEVANVPIVEKPLLGNALLDSIHAVMGETKD
jgi:two-component system, LuxR family, response regulator FixJ